MRLKQFIFALVAMLSLTFSVSAQTVSTAADLKNALSSTGAVVTLGDNITMTEVISIPQGISVTLDLNGKKITGNHSGYVFDITGSLTVKDSQGTGTVTGKSRVFTVKSKGSLTLNGGKFSKTSGQVIYTSGKLVVNGGVVETAPNATLNVNTAAITGAGGTVVLKGGTVTSIAAQFCDLKISGAGATVTNGLNIYKGAKGAEITAGTIKGDVTIADEAKDKVTISGGSFEDNEAIKDCMADGSALLDKGDGTFEIVAGLLKIGDTYYPTLDAAFKAAADGATIELINQEGAVIAMNGSLYGKNVTITGTAKVDWSKGFLFVGRGGEGNATLTFDNANLTSASDNASTGIHVSGREKGTNNKYDGTLVIKNSTIELDYLINRGTMTLDNSTLTVKNGFGIAGRPASETESGANATATISLANNSKVVVNNHNGMGLGQAANVLEGQGVMNIDASSTFEHTQDFIVSANGTMDVKGTLVSNGKKLTNNGEVKFTATKLTAATIEGTGTTRFYNEVNFYGANSITTTGINGTPFHLVINEGANLFITRFVLGYDRNITVNGTITDASAFNPAGQTPSLKFNSTSGVSVGGTGTGNLTVNNAYIELGNSSWKNAQGTYDWDFVNSYVSATSFTNATGADAATWDVTFDKSVLAAKNYIKNGNNVTYHFTNNSRGTTGSLRIDGVLNIDATSSVVTTSQQNNKVGAVDEHGGINGTVNVAGNLTIGSNAKTQLEVLGGTVNVDNGATLALGNNTMTLDAASALQSAGNISGAITAANGANVAITGGTYTQDVSNWCADGFMTQQNADGSFGIAKAAAKVGDKKYASLDEAVQAAKVGDKIVLLDNADLAFAHNPQYNNVYASEIDLNGKTMTIKKGDVRFDKVTIKNGNIIVQPGTYNGTAIFLMYSKNLTFDGVKVTATGVAAAAYLIGLEGTSNLNLLNGSEIVINNESLVNIGSIIADNGNGNTVTIKDSKIDIKNSNARLYLGGTNGNITVENSDIDLNGVKEGFYLRAGQTLAITGTSTVDITLNTNEGRYGINLTDLTATYTKAETATVNATLKEVTPAAVIGTQKFASLQAAINAVQNGETITLTDNVTGNITLTEKVGLHYTIDGTGKTMNGKITITPLSDENDNRRITIKGINFVNTADAAVDFISCAVTNHYPRLTVEGCTFTGNGKNTDVALRLKTAYGAVIKDCTGTGLHSFLQNTAGKNLTIEGVTVTESKGAFALGTVQGVTIKGSTIDVATYGIRMDANTYNNNAVIEGNTVTAFIPVVVRNVNTQSNVTFTGENTFTAENTDGKWMVIGTTEYEENGKLPAEVATGNVVVALNGANLSYEGVHGAGLAGKGTAEAPYLINNVAELELFRNSVNAGSTKYNAPGVWVALGADIDLANAEWTVGIGDGHNFSFDGNFDGKNHTIKNLNIKPYADADSYICGGLFGYTYGAVTIKNLVIENATVNFATPETGKTYHNVGVLVGFANNKDGKLNVDNVIVKGDIKVDAPQTFGVGAIVGYSYREMGAITNTKVLANAGSYIKGERFVGGITGYSYNNAIIENCTVENLALTGEIGVGGIAGLALNGNKIAGCTVKDVTVNGDKNVAYIVGELGSGDGGNVTVADNCNAPQPWVGGSYGTGESFVATIGTQYYTSIAKAIEAAKETDVISLITDITASDIITINKPVTIDGKGKTLTSTAGRAINVDYEGNVGIKNLTINAKGERAINVIQKPANVTIENVTATAANYTVNLASSAGAAKVAISNSNLTGLNVVNVAAAGSEITINGGTITCNDQNANENYAALAMNKDAVGAKIAANGVTFDIKGDSKKASNGAVGGEITIDGKTEEVDVIVAYIQYGNYYNSYTSIEAAIAKAKDGETIGLIRDITASEIITINKAVTLDGKGKTLTSTAGRAINVDCEGNVGIKNLTINAKGERAINVIQKPANVTIDSVTATAANYTVNLATSAGAAKVAINGSKLTGLNVVNVSAPGAEVTIDGGSITCNDQNANENYAALVLSKEAKNGKITANGVTFDIKGDSKKASNAATGGVITIDGSTDDVSVVVAYISYGNNSYTFTSIEEAIKFAKAGDVVTIMPGEYNKALNVDKAGITVQGETDAEGNNLVKFNGKLNITANGAAVKNITVKNSGTAAYINAADVLVENCNLEGSNGLYQSYAKGTVTFKNSVITGGTYGVHFDGSTGGNIVIEGCTITGWTSFAGTIANVEISKTTFADGNYDQLRFYQNATLTECVFNENMTVDFGKNTIEAEFTECTVENGKPLTDVIYLGDIAEGVKVTIDDKPISVQAKAGKNYYQTLLEAVDSAKTGETVTLLTDVALDTKTLATQNDGYAVLVNVNGKKVTLDLNGKKITVNAAAADLASAKGGMLLGVFSADLNGHLTLTDNTDAKNGAVTLNVNDAKVYGMFVSESGQSDKSNSGKITVNGGNYTTVGKVSNAMFFADANEVITVNGGNFHCDQVSNTANYPWMFNTVGNNEIHVIVNGGTFNVDINHQHRPFEVKVPETLAVKANDNGTWTVVPAEAYITEMLGATVNEAGEWGHKVGYATIAEAIAAVNELGNKVSIAKDLELTETVVVPADKTMVLDLNGKTVTMNDASGAAAALLKNNGNLTITDDTEAKAGKLSFKTTTPSAANAYASNTISNYGTLTIEGGNVENLSVGGGACYALDNYAGSTATINGGKLTAEKTAVRIFNWTDGEAAKATINMNGGEIYSKNGYGINVNSGNTPFVALNITGGTITTDYADYKLAVYVVNKNSAENLTINVTGGTFNGIFALNGVTAKTMKQDAVAVSGGTFEGVTCYDDPAYGFVSGGTFDAAVDTKYVATGFICKDNGDGTFGVIVDPKHGKVAQIIRNDYYAENQYFATINEAVQAAQSGETVTLIADVETSAEGYATVGEENYAVIVAVKEKDITLNLNGKSVTVNPTAEELANAEGKMLMSVFGMDKDGKLTLTGNGSVKVNANGANVYSLIAAYGEGSAVVIENGNYEADAVIASGSLIYSHEMITVMGGTYKLGNIATGANGSPWIFNTVGQNYTGVKVVGGTFPTDINHQFWANEVLVPEAYALKDNGDGTWTVVDAVAYTNEKATSRNASWRHVGYASLEDAIAATGKYNCQDNTVTMFKDITLEPITIANGVKVALDLNGKTISGTDNGTASYGLITNKGDLTINGTGAITLTATQDRGWNAYSSVISNQVGGKLTVNGGTIQHLGGTAMAWGIDNLTNGKGTYAETVINGGVVKSKYIAIRQFLNGVEADNILTVNGGTLEGETASLYFQDPSKNANTGTLNVLDGTLAGDVYLDVTEGSTEWPVEVYIAKDALGQNDIHADNVPADAAALVEYDTFWQVEQKNLAELTIEDACEEYINKIEKNVGVLTYKRYFDDTEWQTIVLPFDVPVANLKEQFEVAYIYNASYKGKQATIDYVVIDENSAIETLRANYPYMIRAKAEGWNNIVVENAKLMPTTEVETLDCSSVFEKFSFIGSYATVDTETLDATKGYFNLISGAWSQLGTVNPFRFYMQIEKRDGSAFEYPATEAKAIRMRQVDANGEATGIDSVGAVTEQNSGLIFDLHGRRVVEPKKGGLYIVNGKKVVF